MTQAQPSSHNSSGLKGLLSFPKLYEAAVDLVGYRKAMACLAKDHIRANKTDFVVDIGCGTAIILDFIPPSTPYVGFDMNPKYINKNLKKFVNRKTKAEFLCMPVATVESLKNRNADIILAISVLHHLTDDEVKKLFAFVELALKPGGRLITYDPVIVPHMGLIEKSLVKLDRGQAIRTPEAYKALVPKTLSVKDFIRRDMGWRVPAVAFVMEISKPVSF